MRQNYRIGDIIKVQVKKITKNNVVLQSKDGKKFYLTITEASDYFVSLSNMFKIGDIKEVIVTKKYNDDEFEVSFKLIHPKELRNPFDFKLEDDEGFDKLLEFTKKGISYGK
ncbi:small subunit ribosomal protein S1 [Metamycoplasma subdolum]|uniref:Small subunit ribosomal protein S1 n=1 Tax=Metamycoplasma subdolum TaxID=92407 RepID=A0A3M0A0H8_9BACT|nr:hypothetical protein [Metamycoplasma subdolum]RMA78513.1 small subunit ribosomal protein S1 [Metamycoplasma subdolum]WPB50445.1 hypothetical protein R9C05_02460 [Metamycoplasma subdolum]